MAGGFDGKAALITGAGSGMGRAITVRLAAEGAAVLAIDVDAARLLTQTLKRTPLRRDSA